MVGNIYDTNSRVERVGMVRVVGYVEDLIFSDMKFVKGAELRRVEFVHEL